MYEAHPSLEWLRAKRASFLLPGSFLAHCSRPSLRNGSFSSGIEGLGSRWSSFNQPTRDHSQCCVAEHTDNPRFGCAKLVCEVCAGQSVDCPDPNFVRNVYTRYVYHMNARMCTLNWIHCRDLTQSSAKFYIGTLRYTCSQSLPLTLTKNQVHGCKHFSR